MKVREVIKMIESDGWELVASKGSHRQYKHRSKPGRVTIAGNPTHDLAAGTLILQRHIARSWIDNFLLHRQLYQVRQIRNPNIEALRRTPYGGNKYEIQITKI